MEQEKKIIHITPLTGGLFDLEITIKNKDKKNIYPMLNFYTKEVVDNNYRGYTEFSAKIKNTDYFLTFRKNIVYSGILKHAEYAFKKSMDYNRLSIINKL